MKAIVVTNMYPTETHPASGTFIADQVRSLREADVDVDLLFVDRPRDGRQVYGELPDRVRRLVETSKPDVVHVMYGGVMAAAVTRAVRERPVLVSFCGDDLLGSRGNGFVETVSGGYGTLASRRAAARAAGIIVKSKLLFDALPRGIDKKTTWILPNGVDFSRFRPLEGSECRRQLGWNSGRRHVLFPAPRSRPEKRYSLAEAAVEVLNANGADVELHALENIPHEHVPVWLNAADATLLTSRREGSPNAVKEALACNVPVVSVDVGDVGERLDGIDGSYVADSNPQDIAAKLSRVLERDEPLRSREHIAELSLERVAAKLKDIYRTVASRQAAEADR